jgi:hypothetical protein
LRIQTYPIILLLLAGINCVHSSDLEFRAHMGRGGFAMSDIHKLQNSVLGEYHELSIDAKITSGFPDYYYTRIDAINTFGQGYTWGLTWLHMETGGRIHYEDYSGEIRSDQFLSSNGLGLYNSWILKGPLKLNIKFNFPIYALWSKILLEDKTRIYTEETGSSIELVAKGLGFDPGLSFSHSFSRFQVSLEGGYHLTLSEAFHLKENSDAILRLHGRKVAPNWSGFRVGISLGYKLYRQSD